MYYLIIFSLICLIECKKEPLIVGGEKAQIKRFSHSAYFNVRSPKNPDPGWSCGSSIINQRILLTAAHCVDRIFLNTMMMSISVGHSHKKKGSVSSVQSYYMHEDFKTPNLKCDIALLRLKTDLKFSLNVGRVALMEKPPRFYKAMVAGWGAISDLTQEHSNVLKSVEQFVWERSKCLKMKIKMPKGVLCASVRKGVSHISGGDSGSALIVHGFIQIGIVSYTEPKISKIMAMYTDTRYFYNWTVKHTKRLYCDN